MYVIAVEKIVFWSKKTIQGEQSENEANTRRTVLIILYLFSTFW